MATPKTYVPKSKAKVIQTQYGEMMKLGFQSAALVDFIKANTNAAGYINLNVQERREPDQYGNTHSVSLDTWEPKGRSDQPQRPAQSQGQTDDQDPPF